MLVSFFLFLFFVVLLMTSLDIKILRPTSWVSWSLSYLTLGHEAGHWPIAGHKLVNTNKHSNFHSHLRIILKVFNKPQMHDFGMWEEVGSTSGKPHKPTGQDAKPTH